MEQTYDSTPPLYKVKESKTPPFKKPLGYGNL